MRARNNEIKICESVARIITGNASSPSAWLGRTIPWSGPLKRKSIAFQIRRPLSNPTWNADLNATGGGSSSNATVVDGASTIMQRRLADAGLAAPPTLEVVPGLSRFCPRRRTE